MLKYLFMRIQMIGKFIYSIVGYPVEHGEHYSISILFVSIQFDLLEKGVVISGNRVMGYYYR